MVMLRPAEEMKDSGIEWIEKIPISWDCIRFKHVHNGANVGMSIDREYWSEEENDYPFYTAQIRPIHMNYPEFPKWKFTSENDLLLARNATPYVYVPMLHSAYTDHIIRVCINDGFDRRYIRYCLQNSITYDTADGVSLPTWSISIWNRQWLPLPALSEQQAIADYLDDRCSKIDEIIAEATASIEEYKELKQAVIFEAVTKGLDKNAPMKSSNLTWIGNIPKAWKSVRVKDVSSRITVGVVVTPAAYFDDNGTVPFLRGINVKEFTINDNPMVYITDETNRVLSKTIVHTNDLVVVRDGSIGVTAVVPEKYDGANVVSMIIVTPNEMCDSDYLCYVMNSLIGKVQFDLTKIGAALSHTSVKSVSNIDIILPPLEEQEQIVNALDQKVGDIDHIISNKKSLIDDLQAYKKSLIYEVVTGKRRVV